MQDELDWMSPRKTVKYIPKRYQALVAQIVAAFLFINVFHILFTPRTDGGACGTLIRPVGEEGEILWFQAGLFSVNDALNCPRSMHLLWWEFFASFIGLAICGFVLRNAIKRMPSEHREATKNL